MARQLMIVFKLDGIALTGDEELIDLSQYLGDVIWRMGVSDGSKPVDDVLTFHIEGDDDDDLATDVQALDYIVTRINRFNATLENRYPFLLAQLDGETNYRIAPIYSAKRPESVDVSGLFMADHILPEYQLTITRGPWENDTSVELTDSSVDCLGGVVTYDIDGDLPARIVEMDIVPDTDMEASTEIWVGCKSAQRLTNYIEGDVEGTVQDLTKFVPWWALKDASRFGTDTTGGNSDTGNKSASVVVCTFATATALTPRVVMRMEDAIDVADLPHNLGRYAILLRAKTTSTCKATVRLGMGYYHSGTPVDNFSLLYEMVVQGTDWKLYNLGTIDFPVRFAGVSMQDYAVQIEAERETGTSGNLVMDGLVIMPDLEGMLYAKSEIGITYDSGGGTGRGLYGYTNPLGEMAAYLKDLSTLIEKPMAEAPNWGAEPGGGIFVVATQCLSPTQAVTFYAVLRERWITLRGDTGAVVA
jgi:hypothetical protein